MRDAEPATGLDPVRSELRRLGYLEHRVERFLLQDALRPERPLRTLLLLAAKVGCLAGAPLALAAALLLATLNGHLRTTPFDVLPLFLHLLPLLALGVALAFLTLGGLLVLVLHVSHVRRIEALSFSLAALAAVAAGLVAAWQGRAIFAAAAAWELTLVAIALPLLTWALAKIVHGGLLSLAIRLTDLAPERASSPRWWITLGLLLGLVLFVLPAVLAVRGKPAPALSHLPMSPRERVLLLGLDGVLPAELQYLLAAGDLPVTSSLVRGQGRLLAYPRPAGEAPAALWSSLATGRPSPVHGMVSLDSFRPRGVERPLGQSGWLRHYWARIEMPLGLAEHRPVLAYSRRVHAFWELAARGGGPVVVVNWWGTFPADPLPGLVVSHGAYQLLAEEADGAVAPAAAQAELATLRRELARSPTTATLPEAFAALPRGAELADKALLPDVFYRAVFRRALALRPRVAALYLPALDIVAESATLGTVAHGDLVRWQLRAADELLGEALAGGGIDTVAVVFDPGRRGGGEGRALLWRRAGCAAEPATAIALEAVTAGLVRALGLPQSRELPEPPATCRWPGPSLVVDSYGSRQTVDEVTRGDEYLENLRSLGYL